MGGNALAGNVLGGEGAAVAPVCRLRKSANQSIGGAATTIITWDRETRDDNDWHSNTVNNTRITVDKDGLYELNCTIRLTSNISTSYNNYLGIYVNGSIIYETGIQGVQSRSIFAVHPLTSGDYVEFVIYNAGGGRTLNGGSIYTQCFVREVLE